MSVAEPGSVQEVAEVVRDAAERGVPVRSEGSGTDALHRGGGSGDEVVLSTRRLSGVHLYEPADLTFTAGAGTTLGALDEALGEHGQFLPFDPPLAPRRTLGGLVAAGLGGPLGAGYGLVRDQVLGVTLVTGDGRVLELGGRVMKNVAGFDLVRLVVGSAGRLGVVVSASLRVFPRPEVDRVCLLEGSLPELLDAAAALRTAPRVPASAVLARPSVDGPCSLLLRLHGSRSVVDADQALLQDVAPGGWTLPRGPEVQTRREAARDAGMGSAVRLRLTALPARLGELMEALGGEPFLADVMTGGVTVGLGQASADVPEADEGRVRTLAGHARGLGGSARLLSGPAAWNAAVQEEGPAAELADRVRRRFDPRGILQAGGTA